MTRYVIVIDIFDDEINVSVRRNRKFYDEAGFHVTETNEFIEYMKSLAEKISS